MIINISIHVYRGYGGGRGRAKTDALDGTIYDKEIIIPQCVPQKHYIEVGMDDEYQIPTQEIINVGKSYVLPAGTPLQVEVEGVTVKLNSVSIGFLQDQYIVIRYPYSANLGSITHKLFKGNKIMVHYLKGGSIFGFQSALIGSTNEPFKLIFIEYPTMIIRQSLRKSRRVECSLPARLSGMGAQDRGIIHDIVHTGVISDLSLTGCAFNMRVTSRTQPFPDVRMNEPVVMVLQLPGVEDKLEVFGEVRRMQRDSQKMEVGVQFQETDENVATRLADFILAVEKFTTGE
jgi:hypothetical protein